MPVTQPNITALQQQVLQASIDRLVESFNPEAIICYGARHVNHENWSSFKRLPESTTRSHYHLLIITRSEETFKEQEVLDKISRLNGASLRLIPVVRSIKAVQDSILKGNRFFTTVCKNGTLLYGRTIPDVSSIKDETSPDIDLLWAHHSGLANQFLVGAEHYLSQGQPALSVFMLHQATEHACIAIIRACLGYRSTTHNLNRLLALTENISIEMSDLFPRRSETEKGLFKLLAHAYGDVRYRPSFSIPPEQAKALFENVRELISAAERTYHDFQRHAQTTELTILELTPFDSLGIDTFAKIVLQKGDRESIRIESNIAVLDILQIHVDNNRLWITSPPDIGVNHEVTIIVTYRSVSGLVVYRSPDVTCRGPIEGARLGVIHIGRGSVSITVEVFSLDVTLTKSGNLTIAGSSEEVKALNTGTGNIEASNLEATEAGITIKGSGNVSIQVEEELSAVLQGTGDLMLSGSPRVKSLTGKTGQLKKSI
jgi:HEPN domain-containing protein